MFSKIILTIILGFLTFGHLAAEVEVSGKVTATKDKRVIAGAVVKILGMSNLNAQWQSVAQTTTNQKGEYELIFSNNNLFRAYAFSVELFGKEIYRTSFPKIVPLKFRQDFEIPGALNFAFSPLDMDKDGISDDYEDYLAFKFAPFLYLHPDESFYPSSVDAFLEHSQLVYLYRECHTPRNFQYNLYFEEFQYNVADSCEFKGEILSDVGELNQANLFLQTLELPGRTHAVSAASDKGFRLWLSDRGFKHGEYESFNWPTYVHVFPSAVISNGYDIQYWFFYPYNPSVKVDVIKRDPFFQHEGDWEHVTVTVDFGLSIHSMYYAAHTGGTRRVASEIDFNDENDPDLPDEKGRPIVYVANGSHASYPEPGKYNKKLFWHTDFPKKSDKVWRTWENLINVGERGFPLNDQNFIKFSGKWGIEDSAPDAPAFREKTWLGDEGFSRLSESPEHLQMLNVKISEGQNKKIWAKKTISASHSLVEAGGELYFQTAERIILKHGFVVKKGSVFNAVLETFDLNSQGKGPIVPIPIKSSQSQGRFENQNEKNSDKIIPKQFDLSQNYPNPFNPETVIRYQLPEPGHVTLRIFNLLGQELVTLKNAEMPAGYHAAHWNGKDHFGNEVASGVYIYRIEVKANSGNQFVDTKRMSLMR